ncbi:hypothetical protein F2Q68_00007340 [Brassica cretica]|uniref:HTH myb-type domain-containing protein n=1 Tax=Brassica cretica TaxID=69181 RepID=A0A8S9L1Z8_BRACR|nr:hypothetical protein F2Q68_00007340 [Brassica cretica]
MRKKVSSSGEEGNNEYKKGLWTVEEDKILMDYVKAHGKGHWNRIAKKTDDERIVCDSDEPLRETETQKVPSLRSMEHVELVNSMN